MKNAKRKYEIHITKDSHSLKTGKRCSPWYCPVAKEIRKATGYKHVGVSNTVSLGYQSKPNYKRELPLPKKAVNWIKLLIMEQSVRRCLS